MSETSILYQIFEATRTKVFVYMNLQEKIRSKDVFLYCVENTVFFAMKFDHHILLNMLSASLTKICSGTYSKYLEFVPN